MARGVFNALSKREEASLDKLRQANEFLVTSHRTLSESSSIARLEVAKAFPGRTIDYPCIVHILIYDISSRVLTLNSKGHNAGH